MSPSFASPQFPADELHAVADAGSHIAHYSTVQSAPSDRSLLGSMRGTVCCRDLQQGLLCFGWARDAVPDHGRSATNRFVSCDPCISTSTRLLHASNLEGRGTRACWKTRCRKSRCCSDTLIRTAIARHAGMFAAKDRRCAAAERAHHRSASPAVGAQDQRSEVRMPLTSVPQSRPEQHAIRETSRS